MRIDGLSKPAVATIAEGSISSRGILDGLFDSFGKETVSDNDDNRNYNDIGKLSNETDPDLDSGSSFNRYLDTSDDKVTA